MSASIDQRLATCFTAFVYDKEFATEIRVQKLQEHFLEIGRFYLCSSQIFSNTPLRN